MTILFWLSYWFETKVNKKPFMFNEIVKYSKLSKFPLTIKLLLVGGLLVVAFSGGAMALGSSIIDIPQPFSDVGFTQATQYDKIFHQAIIPGFFEEAAIYFIVMLLFFMLKWLIKSPKSFFIITLIVSMIGAGVLTQGHRVAYGSDQNAYIGVFLFETVVQMGNLYTGAFISWMPHIGHNATVVLFSLYSISLGLNFLMQKRWFTDGKKKG